MKFFYTLLFAALAAATCFPGYYGDNCLQWCNGYIESGACVECGSNLYSVDGKCVSFADGCGSLLPLYSKVDSCSEGSGASEQKCVIKDGSYSIVSNTYCYSNTFDATGIPVGTSAVDMVLTFKGLLPGHISYAAKNNLIFTLIKVFPFTVSNIDIAFAQAKNVDANGLPNSEPITDVFVRIATLPSYTNYYLSSEQSDSSQQDSIASSILKDLKENLPTVFHPAVSLIITSVTAYDSEEGCKRIEDDQVTTYDFGTILYLPCPENQVGNAITKCTAIEGESDWSAIDYSNCKSISGFGNENEAYIDIEMVFNKVNSQFINSEVILNMYSAVISSVHASLLDFEFFGIKPNALDIDSSSVSIRFTVQKDKQETYLSALNYVCSNVQTILSTTFISEFEDLLKDEMDTIFTDKTSITKVSVKTYNCA
ncbi:hypothetical protein WA158_002566 [Blastocystis sp. Blastoise]